MAYIVRGSILNHLTHRNKHIAALSIRNIIMLLLQFEYKRSHSYPNAHYVPKGKC